MIPNDLSSIVLYPNPFKPSRAKDGVMKIINLTDSTKSRDMDNNRRFSKEF